MGCRVGGVNWVVLELISYRFLSVKDTFFDWPSLFMSQKPLQLRVIPVDLVRYLLSVGYFSFKGFTVYSRVVSLKL